MCGEVTEEPDQATPSPCPPWALNIGHRRQPHGVTSTFLPHGRAWVPASGPRWAIASSVALAQRRLEEMMAKARAHPDMALSPVLL